MNLYAPEFRRDLETTLLPIFYRFVAARLWNVAPQVNSGSTSAREVHQQSKRIHLPPYQTSPARSRTTGRSVTRQLAPRESCHPHALGASVQRSVYKAGHSVTSAFAFIRILAMGMIHPQELLPSLFTTTIKDGSAIIIFAGLVSTIFMLVCSSAHWTLIGRTSYLSPMGTSQRCCRISTFNSTTGPNEYPHGATLRHDERTGHRICTLLLCVGSFDYHISHLARPPSSSLSWTPSGEAVQDMACLEGLRRDTTSVFTAPTREIRRRRPNRCGVKWVWSYVRAKYCVLRAQRIICPGCFLDYARAGSPRDAQRSK